MTNKTEDDIAREKEMVQKMVGAKSAMDAALSRIDRLERAIAGAVIVLEDAQKRAGNDLYVKTHYHGARSDGNAQVILFKDQIGYAKSIIEAVK